MTTHKSDCATHNAPAMEPGPCDCGVRLAEIRARADAATEEPWSWLWLHSAGFVAQCDLPPHDITSRDIWPGPETTIIADDVSDEDGEFIAHARIDIPYLLSLIAARDAEIAALRLEKDGTDAGYEFAVESKAEIAKQRDKLRYNLAWAYSGLDQESALAHRIDLVLKEIP